MAEDLEENTNVATGKFPDAKQIAAWKKEHGSLHQIEVKGKKMILREPQLADLERAQAADPKKKKIYNFHRSIIANCKLYEDEGLMSDDKNIMAVFSQLDEIVEIPEATTKKL